MALEHPLLEGVKLDQEPPVEGELGKEVPGAAGSVMQIPVVPLNGTNVEVIDNPNGGRALLVGPVMLALPLTDAGCKEISGKLTDVKVDVVPAAALDQLNRAQRREEDRKGRRSSKGHGRQ